MKKSDLSVAETYLYIAISAIGLVFIVIGLTANFPEGTHYSSLSLGLGANLLVLSIVFALSLRFSREAELQRLKDLYEKFGELANPDTNSADPSIDDARQLFQMFESSISKNLEQLNSITSDFEEHSRAWAEQLSKVKQTIGRVDAALQKGDPNLEQSGELVKRLREMILYLEELVPAERFLTGEDFDENTVPEEYQGKLEGLGRLKSSASHERPYFQEDD